MEGLHLGTRPIPDTYYLARGVPFGLRRAVPP